MQISDRCLSSVFSTRASHDERTRRRSVMECVHLDVWRIFAGNVTVKTLSEERAKSFPSKEKMKQTVNTIRKKNKRKTENNENLDSLA